MDKFLKPLILPITANISVTKALFNYLYDNPPKKNLLANLYRYWR